MFSKSFSSGAIGLFIAITVMSCHSGNSSANDAGTSRDTSVTQAVPPTAAPAAPVIVAADDSLTKGIKDATKDYPGVNATASNGEITLTGKIERSKLPDLMMSLNSLHPKKINNQLTVK
jgi:hypothetical protein